MARSGLPVFRFSAAAALSWIAATGCTSSPLSKDKLGALVFNDTELSQPAGQACADCQDRKSVV